MYDLETLLAIEKNRSNKNERFPDSPNSPELFSRLEFNFTFPDPTVIELSDSAKEHLDRMPKLLKDWQAEDMRNNNAKDYYQNPVGSSAKTIKSTADSIVKSSQYEYTDETTLRRTTAVVTGLEDVNSSANVLSSYAESYQLHTDRLSNVVGLDVGEATDPHYLTCSGLGRSVLYIISEVDGIQDTRPVLGSFTSLFVTDDLVELNNRIAGYPEIIENSIVEVPPAEGSNTATYETTLSPSETAAITSDLNAAASKMGDRVAHDKKFWENSKKIQEEYTQFKLMNEEGESQKKIVNLISTDKLKQSLLIEDLPNSIKYDAQVDYFGNVVYKPNTEYQYTINANSPLSIVDSYIDYYSNTELLVTGPEDPSGNVLYKLLLSQGSISLESVNGVWSNTQSITILNLANTAYTFSEVDTSDFEKCDVLYEFYPANTNTLLTGQSILFNVAIRSITTETGIEYAILKIIPGIEFPTKVRYETSSNVGLLSPISVYNVFGSNTAKLTISANNGPYRILADTSLAPDYYTWINNSNYPTTISTIENITPTANASDLTIHLINAANNTTVNVGEKIIWYANVIPNITSPNNSIFKVTTIDGQERLITLGVFGGVGNEGDSGTGVDDSALYNEVLTTNPPDVYANGTPFTINVANGKPTTEVYYTGPDLSGSGSIGLDGTFSILNADGINANGYYTYTFSFVGTGHSRTITKAIFAS